ncbi:MAG: tetratricopeptide repeat protein [Bacteroidota bacterium]
MKKLIGIAIVAIIMMTKSGFAQDNSAALQEAFSSSYTLEKTGDYAKAADALKKLYDEKSYEINLRLGWLTYMGGKFTDACAYYQKAIELMPYGIEARFGYINPAAAMGNWDAVVTQYLEILKTDPQNTSANYKLGSIYYGKAKYAEALPYFEKIVNLYPFDYDSLLMFAWTNYRLGKLREAKVLFNKALLNRPKDASATEGLGLIK